MLHSARTRRKLTPAEREANRQAAVRAALDDPQFREHGEYQQTVMSLGVWAYRAIIQKEIPAPFPVPPLSPTGAYLLEHGHY